MVDLSRSCWRARSTQRSAALATAMLALSGVCVPWLICPYKHIRVAKLYLPNGGDRFASRKAWRLAYNSQRVAHRDRAFEKLFRLQRKLGCEQGYDSFIRRPKGMWNRTFDRYLERFEELDAQCSAEMAMLVLRLGGRL